MPDTITSEYTYTILTYTQDGRMAVEYSMEGKPSLVLPVSYDVGVSGADLLAHLDAVIAAGAPVKMWSIPAEEHVNRSTALTSLLNVPKIAVRPLESTEDNTDPS